MICKKCKKEIDDDSKFCEFCGNKTLKDEKRKTESLKSKKVLVILFIIIILSFLFHWYELRPIQIKKQCSKDAIRESEDWEQNYDYSYKKCLHNKGI